MITLTVLLLICGSTSIRGKPISVVKRANTTCSDCCPQYPQDCYHLKLQGCNTSGPYAIQPKQSRPFIAYCDMETDGGGWTVIQRRNSNYTRISFNRDWEYYTNGFGDVSEEHWLGLEHIHLLTRWNTVPPELWVDIWTTEPAYRHAKYQTFWVEPASTIYRLFVSGYSGNATDRLDYHNGMAFSTPDRDNDLYSGHCADSRDGGWWFRSCFYSYLNGGAGSNNHFWYWSLHGSEMKIRPSEAIDTC